MLKLHECIFYYGQADLTASLGFSACLRGRLLLRVLSSHQLSDVTLSLLHDQAEEGALQPPVTGNACYDHPLLGKQQPQLEHNTAAVSAEHTMSLKAGHCMPALCHHDNQMQVQQVMLLSLSAE